MQNFQRLAAFRATLLLVMGAFVLSLAWPLAGVAQDKSSDKDLAAQVRELQTKVTKLEAALKQGHKGTPSASGTPDTGGMAGMPGMHGKGMGMMGGPGTGTGGSTTGMTDQQMMQMMQMMQQMMQMKMMEMMGKGMASGTPDMKGTQKGMQMGTKGMEMGMKGMAMPGTSGMEMMGGRGMAGMQTPSALPGFPGASHIYHIGSTGFFLDHPDHVNLTTEQQTALNQAKEKGLLEQSSFQRKIDDAEQELWTLTSSDKPEASKIDAKVREIEKLRGDQRLAFIRAVGEAAKVLTAEQRMSLLGVGGRHAGH